MQRHDLKRRISNHSLKKCRQAGERSLSQLTRCAVLVVLQTLKPDAHAELVNAMADSQVVLICEQISVIGNSRRVVRTRGNDRAVGRGWWLRRPRQFHRGRALERNQD